MLNQSLQTGNLHNVKKCIVLHINFEVCDTIQTESKQKSHTFPTFQCIIRQ
jgi:hypothetical protein